MAQIGFALSIRPVQLDRNRGYACMVAPIGLGWAARGGGKIVRRGGRRIRHLVVMTECERALLNIRLGSIDAPSRTGTTNDSPGVQSKVGNV